ncbi:MAG: TolC family protein [Bacteroidetes bacterium]|nr:TolC family protein [Bacteroidota bacterium]
MVRFLLRGKLIVWLLFLLSAQNVFATDTTLRILTVNEFIGIIKQYHPLAKQAQLLPEQAKAELLIARGGWDPKLTSDYDNKTYDGNNYYSYFENKVTVPVWYGIEVKAGYDYVYGGKINTENTLPKDGLGYLGISVPLVKGMLMDKQRAALRQAQIFREASEQQRLLLLNDLLLDALNTYYDWSYAYNEWVVYSEATRIAEIRFKATVQSALLGDRAAIDTTEALTQLQSRQFQLNEARLRFLNTGLELSNYLWLENDIPAPFDTTIIPAALESDFLKQQVQWTQLDEWVTELRQTHPALLNYNFKLKQLDIERRLKLENLKPTLNANYNVLSERLNFRSNAGIVFSNNYKFGVNFSMPLTFMQGRGELKLTKLKILDTKYTIDFKQQELVNKLKSYFNDLIALQQQTKIYESSVAGFKTLFDGETSRLDNGESSLFLVNARENRYLDSQVKLSELQAKYYKKQAALKWAVGNIGR